MTRLISFICVIFLSFVSYSPLFLLSFLPPLPPCFCGGQGQKALIPQMVLLVKNQTILGCGGEGDPLPWACISISHLREQNNSTEVLVHGSWEYFTILP